MYICFCECPCTCEHGKLLLVPRSWWSHFYVDFIVSFICFNKSLHVFWKSSLLSIFMKIFITTNLWVLSAFLCVIICFSWLDEIHLFLDSSCESPTALLLINLLIYWNWNLCLAFWCIKVCKQHDNRKENLLVFWKLEPETSSAPATQNQMAVGKSQKRAGCCWKEADVERGRGRKLVRWY